MEDQLYKELEEIDKELKELGDLVTQAKTVAQQELCNIGIKAARIK